jgi:hypothetical protein
MAEMWYYTQDGKPMEPVPREELQRLAVSGLLKPTDLVWKDGMADWVRAGAASGLYSEDEAITATEVASSSGTSRPRNSWQPAVQSGGVRRSSWGDDDEKEDAERLRRRRTHPQRRRMSAGLKVVLFLGGSLVALIAIGVALTAVRSHERARAAQAQALQRRQALRFNQAPGGVIRPRFNAPLQGPFEHPPSFMGPITVGPQDTLLKNQIDDADSRAHMQLHDEEGLFEGLLRCKVFTVAMTEGKTYTIRLESLHFDAALTIEDSNFLQLADDDDSGGGPLGLDALIKFPCRRTGNYRVIAAALHDGKGPFTLKIKEE